MTPQSVRRLIFEQSKRANVGHIGSALSVVEILVALYGGAMDVADPAHPDRDRFILSKGHAALALYAVLHLRGWVSAEQLETYCANGSALGVHPELGLPGIDFATGSLGQGLGVGAGAALAARMSGSARRVFVLMSDAECNEGSVWEAIQLAAHRRLSNLVAIVDLNGQQALGYTRDVLDLSPMADRWRAFGWDVREIDGHDLNLIRRSVDDLDTRTGPPHVLVARTTFGKGVSYMENQIRWHYMPMSDREYETALAELAQQ